MAAMVMIIDVDRLLVIGSPMTSAIPDLYY